MGRARLAARFRLHRRFLAARRRRDLAGRAVTARRDQRRRYRRRERAKPGDLPSVLNSEEAAALLGCGLNEVRRLVREGELIRLPWGGSAIRLSKHEVLRYLRGLS